MPREPRPAVLRIPQEAIDQLAALVSVYHRLQKNAGAGAPVRPGCDDDITALETRLNTPSEIWWTHLITAEMCVTEVSSDALVRSRVPGWRRRMQEVIGDARYAQYIGGAPNPQSAKIDDVRADLSQCIGTVYYFYSSYGVAARSRSNVTRDTFGVALRILLVQSLVAGLFALHSIVSWWPSIPLKIFVGFELVLATSAVAVLGSVVSVQLRLQDPKVEVDPFYRYIQTSSDRLSIAVVSPLFAAVFGIMMFLLIASGLSGGKAFPLLDHLISANPSLPDVSLLLVYGFIAGFAERLVPDALSRFAQRTLESLSGAGAPPTPPPPASTLMVSVPSMTLAPNDTRTFTATVPGGKDDIMASSGASAVATVDTDAKKPPGPVTFTVKAVSSGHTTITVTSGKQTATVQIDVS